MSERTAALTHKGWLLLCPVYFADLGTPAPVVEPRWECVRWLEGVSLAIFELCVTARMCLDPYYEPSFPLLVTGRLAEPKVIGLEDEDAQDF